MSCFISSLQAASFPCTVLCYKRYFINCFDLTKSVIQLVLGPTIKWHLRCSIKQEQIVKFEFQIINGWVGNSGKQNTRHEHQNHSTNLLNLIYYYNLLNLKNISNTFCVAIWVWVIQVRNRHLLYLVRFSVQYLFWTNLSIWPIRFVLGKSYKLYSFRLFLYFI